MSSQRDQAGRQQGGRETEWDAYSDYQHVSRRVAGSIGDAVDSLIVIERAKVNGESIKPSQETDLQADVLGAVVRLRTELENERDSKQVYDEILSRWEGEDGFVSRFRTVDVADYQPEPWLEQFASDIHRAGWELGHPKAGREETTREGGDAYDGEVREMIEGMTV